jgi:hypothetical protein
MSRSARLRSLPGCQLAGTWEWISAPQISQALLVDSDSMGLLSQLTPIGLVSRSLALLGALGALGAPLRVAGRQLLPQQERYEPARQQQHELEIFGRHAALLLVGEWPCYALGPRQTQGARTNKTVTGAKLA